MVSFCCLGIAIGIGPTTGIENDRVPVFSRGWRNQPVNLDPVVRFSGEPSLPYLVIKQCIDDLEKHERRKRFRKPDNIRSRNQKEKDNFAKAEASNAKAFLISPRMERQRQFWEERKGCSYGYIRSEAKKRLFDSEDNYIYQDLKPLD